MNEDDKEIKEKLRALWRNAKSQMREPDLRFDTWNVNYFIEGSPLEKYLNSLNELIGQKINAVLTMGCVFNIDYLLEGEDKFLRLDEPVVVTIGNTHFEVWYHIYSRVKIGLNTLTLKEKSYHKDWEWLNSSQVFKDGIIGQKVVRFEVKKSTKGDLLMDDRPDGGDYFESFRIVLENNQCLEFSDDYDYMAVTQCGISEA